MAKRAVSATACFAIFFCMASSGCVTRGPVLSPVKTELAATPFFPQTRHHCGPAALATVLGASGAEVTPETLTPLVYIPGRRGSLQLEMLAAPRGFARLALPLPRTPEAIIAELESGRPVLVLHNYGLPSWPRWHYAVVVGYDSDKDVFTLRSGTTQREEMRTRRFMVAWHYAARWAMVVLRPGETAATADAKTYLESAADFERAAKPEDARLVFDAAIRRWPGEPVALVGRGTAEYRLGHLDAAARDYAAALALDDAQVGARNNLAQVLVDLKCPHRAREQLATIDAGSLPPALRDAVLDTRRLAEAAASMGADAAGCSTFP
jgi:tetratricopeptide (TPR) repeat protein